MSSGGPELIEVTFAPEGQTVRVLPGADLIEAAARAGIVIDTPCGRTGGCGKCRVEISRGAPPPSEADLRHLSAEDIAKGTRLACRTRVTGDMTVAVPVASRLFEHRILTSGKGRKVPLDPTVVKRHLTLPAPALGDQRADEDRLLDALKQEKVRPGLDVLRRMPHLLREKSFDATVALAEGQVIALEPGDTTSLNFGMAFDIGTTTVVGFLVELTAGRELAVAARTNPQVPLGDDVVSRIHHACTKPDGLRELQRLITSALNEIIAECCRKAGIRRENIYEAAVVGNTAMGHLFLGIAPDFIAQAPYVAAVRRAVDVPARALSLDINPDGIVRVLPNVAGFVGADTVGVILAAGMHKESELCLAIDIGTNGELVIGNKDGLLACSTAAGPAFEGARIRHGMRAAEGAIDGAVITDDLRCSVIGSAKPRGLCGTALIDLAAELLRTGCLEPTGRLLPPGELPSSLPQAVRRRVRETEKGAEFLLFPAGETLAGSDIVLTQRDIRELQLAKGAIAAGAAILMKELNATPERLDRLLLAGAFGNYVRAESARRIGLLPRLPDEKIHFIGNAAGAGARMALISRRCRREADEIAKRTRYLELAGRADFQEAFTDALLFPEGSF